MNKYLKYSFFSLIALFALIALGVYLTSAHIALERLNVSFFILAIVFFIVSALMWIISWAYLIKKHSDISYTSLMATGLAALYGALTPVQLGAEALRAIRLKQHYNIPYSNSIAASMIAKGIKFSILAIVFVVIFLLFMLKTKLGLLVSASLFSGFVVVAAAAVLFLAPLNKNAGKILTSIAARLSKRIKFFASASNFLTGYSAYMKNVSARSYAVVFGISFLSLFFEFLTLQFSFMSLNIYLPFHSVIVLLMIVLILERTPFLPRGIGIVELAGYAYLSVPLLAAAHLASAEIVAVLVVYDFARIVVPTLLGVAVSLLLVKGISLPKNGRLKEALARH